MSMAEAIKRLTEMAKLMDLVSPLDATAIRTVLQSLYRTEETDE